MAETEKMPKDLKEQVEEKKKPGTENPAEVTEGNELGEFDAFEYQREHENDGEVRGNILEQEFMQLPMRDVQLVIANPVQ